MKRVLITFVSLCFIGLVLASVNIVTPFVSISVKEVVPGEKFSLVKNGYPALRIYNRSQKKVEIKFSVLKIEDEQGNRVNKNCIRFEKNIVEVLPEDFAETDVFIKLPKEKKYFGKKFKGIIISEVISISGDYISAGLSSKIFIITKKRKKGIFEKVINIFRR